MRYIFLKFGNTIKPETWVSLYSGHSGTVLGQALKQEDETSFYELCAKSVLTLKREQQENNDRVQIKSQKWEIAEVSSNVYTE